MSELTDVLLKKIRVAYRIDPSHIVAEENSAHPKAEATAVETVERTNDEPAACVCIVASTGGPPALDRVFSGLAGSMPAAYLVVQHLPAGFSESLARRLSGIGTVRVREATNGMRIEPGCAYVAPHGSHMALARGRNGVPRIRFSAGPPVNGVRPAGDVLFESAADVFGERAIGVVLTGMGADGARGAAAILKAGGSTVVQDEATSVVWGMPGAAVRLGTAGRVVSLGLVAAEIRRLIRICCEEALA